VGVLDRFKVAGVIATWWNENQYDLKALVAQGFEGLVDGWVETIAAGLEENSGNHLDEMADDPLALRLLPDYLAELEQARQEVVDLEQEKEAFEAGESDEAVGEDTSEEGERPNYAKELKDQIKELRHTIDEYRKLIKALTGSSKKAGSIAFHKARGEDTKILEAQLKGLEGKVRPVEVKVLELEMRLKPYDEILEKLKAAKKQLKDLQKKFLMRLDEARDTLSEDECRELVLDILKEKLECNLDAYVETHRRLVVAAVENWWEKYRVTLKDIQGLRDNASSKLQNLLKSLQYE
jgi:hypothetical protein